MSFGVLTGAIHYLHFWGHARQR